MSKSVQSTGELYPSQSTRTGDSRVYTIKQPPDMLDCDFEKFSKALKDKVPEVNVSLQNNKSLQMAWKDGKPASMLGYEDVPLTETGKIYALSVWGYANPQQATKGTFTVLRFDGSNTFVYEDVGVTYVYEDDNSDTDDKLKMAFVPSQPSKTRKTTKDRGGWVDRFGRCWTVTTWTPDTETDAASSNARGVSSGLSISEARTAGGEEEEDEVGAGDHS